MNISLKKAALIGLVGVGVLIVINLLSLITFFFRLLFESYFPFNFLNFCSLVGQFICVICFAALGFFLYTFWQKTPEE